MLKSLDDLLGVVEKLYEGQEPPKPFLLLQAIQRLRKGEAAREVARSAKSTLARIEALNSAADPIAEVLKIDLATSETPEKMAKARATLGQLLLGVIAERAFEEIYKTTMGTSELRLEDFRDSRNETDYRVLNGKGIPVFRFNIKFHGTQFRNALTLVGLDPADCFALATYKIFQALQKQDKEVLPYIFAIVGVADLTGALVGEASLTTSFV